MSYKPILIVPGDPNSVFLEIFFKTLKYKKIKSPIVLITSINLLKKYTKKNSLKIKFYEIKKDEFKKIYLKKGLIYVLDINCKLNKNNTEYINKCFSEAFKILKTGITDKFLNGPITKKEFLKKKYFGVTEYIAHKFNSKKYAMLIYNRKLSVCPITTHLPIKMVAKKINKRIIKEKVIIIVRLLVPP